MVNRLLRVLGTFLDLPREAHWVMQPHLTFLYKLGSDAPRSFEVGKTLVRKRVIAKFGTKIKRSPVWRGGVRRRRSSHPLSTGGGGASCGEMGAVAVVDVDLINCFGMCVWPATLWAVDENLPELGPCLGWCLTYPDHVHRSTGLGAPEGPLEAASTVGWAMQLARQRQDMEAGGLLTLALGGGTSMTGSWSFTLRWWSRYCERWMRGSRMLERLVAPKE